MTKRDMHWRMAGVAAFACAAGAGFLADAGAVQAQPGLGTALQLVAFLLYIAGSVLVIQGERLPRAWSDPWRGDRPGRPSARRRAKHHPRHPHHR